MICEKVRSVYTRTGNVLLQIIIRRLVRNSVFSFGVDRLQCAGARWRREIAAGAEQLLDLVHRLALGLGDDKQHKERTQHAEHGEQPERVVNVNGGHQRREEFRDEEREKPVGHAGDRACGTCTRTTAFRNRLKYRYVQGYFIFPQ